MPSFKQEFKRQTRLAITAAIGFIIAFAWRDAVLSWLNFFVSLISNIPSEQVPLSLTALTATLFGAILLFLSSKLLK